MMKGYVFVEAQGPHFVEQAITGIKHVRSRVPGLVPFSEIERYIVVKPVIEELGVDDIVPCLISALDVDFNNNILSALQRFADRFAGDAVTVAIDGRVLQKLVFFTISRYFSGEMK
jgi:hypothetical protein